MENRSGKVEKKILAFLAKGKKANASQITRAIGENYPTVYWKCQILLSSGKIKGIIANKEKKFLKKKVVFELA